jgi:hypothetical protein
LVAVLAVLHARSVAVRERLAALVHPAALVLAGVQTLGLVVATALVAVVVAALVVAALVVAALVVAALAVAVVVAVAVAAVAVQVRAAWPRLIRHSQRLAALPRTTVPTAL